MIAQGGKSNNKNAHMEKKEEVVGQIHRFPMTPIHIVYRLVYISHR